MDEFRKQIVKSWVNRADERYRSSFPGFDVGFFHAENLIFCSIAYEAYAFGKFQKSRMSQNRSDLSIQFQSSFEQLIESSPPDDLINSLNDLKSEINRSPLEDMTPNSNRIPLDLPDKKDLDRVLEIIYRVRSNLLHGGKDVDPTINRNMILVRSSFIILYHVMNMIIREEGLNQDETV